MRDRETARPTRHTTNRRGLANESHSASQSDSVRPHQHRHFTVSKWSPTSTRPRRRSNCTALESMGTNFQSTHSCTSPSPKLDSASRLGIQSPTILHRPSHNASHSTLPAPQLACPPLRRRSPRPPATSNTPELPQRRALTWRPVLRASFNSAVHDATSTLAAVFGALASQPSAPSLVELLSEQWHQQCRVLRDAKQTQ